MSLQPTRQLQKRAKPNEKPLIISISYLSLKPCGGSQLHTDVPRRKSKCWCFGRDRGAECQGGFGDSSRCHQFHIPHDVDCKREASGKVKVTMISYSRFSAA